MVKFGLNFEGFDLRDKTVPFLSFYAKPRFTELLEVSGIPEAGPDLKWTTSAHCVH